VCPPQQRVLQQNSKRSIWGKRIPHKLESFDVLDSLIFTYLISTLLTHVKLEGLGFSKESHSHHHIGGTP
jgi:hypothetical protein